MAKEVWLALGPGLVGVGLFMVALGAYAVRNLRRGRYRDLETTTRGAGGLTGAELKHFFAWLMGPVWRGLAAAEVPPDALTTLAVGLAIGGGVGAALGRFALGGWLFIAAGALDFLDGRVARETGRATRSGAVLDSVLDRYCESAILTGLAWYYRDSWALAPALLALSGSLLVPYVRARGEAIGVVMKDVGFMQRPERIVALGAGVALAPVPQALFFSGEARPSYHLAMATLCLLAAASHATTLQRLAYLLRTLGGVAAGSLGGLFRSPRTILVSSIATVGDFVATQSLVELGVLSPPWATLLGCVLGGVIAFTLSRGWVFDTPRVPVGRQAARYAFVSGTSAVLNASGVALALLIPAMDYRAGWLVSRALVFLTWNFPLFHDFAFPHAERAEEPDLSVPAIPPVARGTKVAM